MAPFITSIATEENHAREYQPLLRRFPDRYPKNYPPGFVQELYANRALLALAQTCRQLRVEMRPLWLSSFHVRVLDEQLPEFRRTFFKQPSNLQYAPKLVEISWQERSDGPEYDPFSATSLVKWRVHSDLFRCIFVSHEVAEGKHPDHDEDCDLVGLGQGNDYDDGWESVIHCTCGFDISWRLDWEQDLLEGMGFTEIWQSLILHYNGSWLEDIKDGAIEVHCASEGEQRTLSTFCFKDCVCKDRSSKQHAVDLFKRWGLGPFPNRKRMKSTFMFGFVKGIKGGLIGTTYVPEKVCCKNTFK